MTELHRRDDGFTLIELLVVILIIGILAAIALPNFMSQGDRGRDATAKDMARNAVTSVEACFVSTQDYGKCVDNDGLGKGLGFELGTAPGEVSIDAPTKDTFTITAVSPTGSKFMLKRTTASSPVSRACEIEPGKSDAGCKGGKW